MPFVSRQQVRACFARNDPNWNCQEWVEHTKDMKALPETVQEEEKPPPKKTLRKKMAEISWSHGQNKVLPLLVSNGREKVGRDQHGELIDRKSVV